MHAAPPKPPRPNISPDRASLFANGRDLARSEKMRTRFAIEGGVIASLMAELGLSTYIDLGCWYGYLLREVVERARPSRAVAVDAIPDVLDFAREFVADWAMEAGRTGDADTIEYLNAAIMPARLRAESPQPRIHPWDTSRSGLFVDGGTPVAGVASYTMDEFFRRLGASDLTRAYLKIDLEGCDDDVVLDLLAAGHRPAVIHYEVISTDFRASKALGALAAAGYAVPRKQGEHSLYSVVCARGRCAAIGFAPDVAYL